MEQFLNAEEQSALYGDPNKKKNPLQQNSWSWRITILSYGCVLQETKQTEGWEC